MRALKRKGSIYKTDNLGLFEYSLESIKEHGKFKLEEYTFDYEFDNKKFKDLNIVYYMPDEVGNEVANATALFELNLTGRLK